MSYSEEIQQAIREVLMQHWDPIGVSGIPEAHDEYDSYIVPIWRLLSSKASDEALVEYLYTTEKETMGLMGFGKRHLKEVATKLRAVGEAMAIERGVDRTS